MQVKSARVKRRRDGYRRRWLFTLAVLSVALGVAAPARAQRETERGAAEALFTEARELMSQGKFAEACPKLVSSYQLDPGLGTLLNLGVCYKSKGQIASAWSTFRSQPDAELWRAPGLRRQRFLQSRHADVRGERRQDEQRVRCVRGLRWTGCGGLLHRQGGRCQLQWDSQRRLLLCVEAMCGRYLRCAEWQPCLRAEKGPQRRLLGPEQ